MNQKSINDGGCAYPITMDFTGPSTNPLTGKPIAANHTDRHIDIGLTKRDYFAAQAIQGLLLGGVPELRYCAVIAKSAYELADAMIAAREA